MAKSLQSPPVCVICLRSSDVFCVSHPCIYPQEKNAFCGHRCLGYLERIKRKKIEWCYNFWSTVDSLWSVAIASWGWKGTSMFWACKPLSSGIFFYVSSFGVVSFFLSKPSFKFCTPAERSRFPLCHSADSLAGCEVRRTGFFKRLVRIPMGDILFITINLAVIIV